MSILLSLAPQLVKVRHGNSEEQPEFKPSRPSDRPLHDKNIGRAVRRPDAQPEVCTDFNGHTAGDTAAVLMHVYDAALSDEFSSTIKDTSYQRATRLTSGIRASGHVSSSTRFYQECKV